MFQDPLHDPRVQIWDQERRRREAQGIYKGPPFLLWGLATSIVFIIVLALILHFAGLF